jgi:hypothetical protein
MTTTLMIERTFHFRRSGHGGRKELQAGMAAPVSPPGRVPRVSRLMALAIRFDEQMRAGVLVTSKELAALGHVTRARISQIMNLVNLAPAIQEELLFLPRTERGRDAIILADLQPIASETSWPKQRQMWEQLLSYRLRPVGQ